MHSIRRPNTLKDPLIYIIDSNPVQGSFIKYHLAGAGLSNTRILHSPKECLEYLSREKSPDFIISDTVLKDNSDIVFAGMVLDSYPGIRIILYSDVEDPDHAEILFSMGVTDFILKTGDIQNWIKELTSNLQFMIRETTPAERGAY